MPVRWLTWILTLNVLWIIFSSWSTLVLFVPILLADFSAHQARVLLCLYQEFCFSWLCGRTGVRTSLGCDTLNDQVPSYLKDLIVRYFPNRALRSQTAGLLVVPRVSKSRMGGRAFSYQAPLLWNKLPVNVREADILSTFKTRLKTFFLDNAYS